MTATAHQQSAARPTVDPSYLRVCTTIAVALGGRESDAYRIIECIVAQAAERSESTRQVPNVKTLAVDLAIRRSTLVSRFLRAKLPAVKRYIDEITLIAAARSAERHPEITVAAHAYALGFAAPQNFNRWIHRLEHMTAATFLAQAIEQHYIDRFVARLIVPYRTTLVSRPLLAADVGTAKRLARRRLATT